ncbi:MAG: DUF1592 domain-containing protein [Polyangiaceae bacterium]
MGIRHALTPFVSMLSVLASLTGCGVTPGGVSSRASGGASGAGVASGGAGMVGGAGSTVGQAGASTSPYLPAGIRRLSNAEFDKSAHALVGNTDPVTTNFAPDTRQGGFTVNDAQRVDSVLIKQISSAASTLAAQVRGKLDTFAPCADATAQAEACAKTFIQSFATKAYRRPLGADESQKLLDLFHVGADGATYADGVELVATGVLQSAAFLYLTEIGDGSQKSPVQLTPYETASAISYLVTGGPPDAPLLTAAASGQLTTPDQRSAQFSRLVQSAEPTDARARVVRVVQEWLGTDRLVDTAKDTTVYGNFAGLKPAMLTETADFVQHLLDKKSGTVGELLGANWTATKDQNLTALYGGTSAGMADGEISLPDRRGILNQGAFLSVYSHASETGPVLRGVAIERRLACMVLPSPSQLKLTIPPLPLDPSKSMRDRLSAHVTDPACAGCHTAIDGFGFSFELYDGMGKLQVMDAGNAVNSKTTVAVGKDFDGAYADSNALATALSQSAAVRECFARNVFRASAGRSDADVAASEQAFVQYWQSMPAPAADASHPQPTSAAQGSILETLRAYVTSPSFTQRRAQ